jgi:hypothetical protein
MDARTKKSVRGKSLGTRAESYAQKRSAGGHCKRFTKPLADAQTISVLTCYAYVCPGPDVVAGKIRVQIRH